MVELSHYGQINKALKVVRFTTALSLVWGLSSGCNPPVPNIELGLSLAECSPIEKADSFTVEALIHESAKERIKNEPALCKLIEKLATIVGAKGKSEIHFISQNISYAEFSYLVKNKIQLNEEQAKYFFEAISLEEFAVSGFHTENKNGTSQIIIVTDQKAYNK